MSQEITRRQALAGGLCAGLVGAAGVAAAGDKKPESGKKDAKPAPIQVSKAEVQAAFAKASAEWKARFEAALSCVRGFRRAPGKARE